MSLKKWQIISVIAIFVISGLWHFGYTIWPNFFTSLIFPVNESIFEHNKIIIFAFLIWGIVERFYLKDKQNVLWVNFLASIICALLVMAIFSPIYFFILKTKDNMIVTFIIFLICIWISNKIKMKLLNKHWDKNLEKYAILGFIGVISLNAFLTYYPLEIGIFYDYNKKIYGRG